MTVYLIRHGESLGQIARDRRNDQSLRDCRLSDQGRHQAARIDLQVDAILCSPLVRALETALIAFPQHAIQVRYDLREIGSSIPENVPSANPLKALKNDYDVSDVQITEDRPTDWPRRHDTPPRVVRRDRVRNILVKLAESSYSRVALVCHFHVIRSALACDLGGPVVQPRNAEPMACLLYADGRLRLQEEGG